MKSINDVGRCRSHYSSQSLRHVLGLLFSPALLCCAAMPVAGSADLQGKLENQPSADLFDLLPIQLAEISVVSASLAPQRLADSPASVTVITREQIQRMGARTIYDLLRHVPGLRVDVTNRGRPLISVRGIRRDTSNQLLFLLDGHSLNEPTNGSAAFLVELSNLPLENIERIEVMLGPGSALFGSNAFLGLVNIITRNAAEIDGTELALHSEWEAEGYIGSDINLLYGEAFQADRSLTFNANLIDREGERIPVTADASGLPGLAERDFEQVDLQARGLLGQYSVQARYTQQDRGESHGALYLLNPDDGVFFKSGFVEIDGKLQLGEHVRLLPRAYFDYYDVEAFITQFRRGTIPPDSSYFAFNETGLYTHLGQNSTKAGFELRASDFRFDSHRVTYGLLWEYQAQDDLRSFGNDIGIGIPVYPFQDVSDFNNFGQDANRILIAPYVEDIWQITDELILNAGLRLDHYSDFGNSWNPRLGLTWRLHPNYRLRALYGTAFRAPDFRSLFLVSPFFNGNSDLNEEQVRTVEIGLSANPVDNLSTRITLFQNDLDRLITIPPGATTFENAGSMTSRGLEFDVSYQWSNGVGLSANYSYVDVTLDNGDPAPDEPAHTASALAKIPLADRLQAGLSVYWQSASPRAAIDSRSALPGYTLLDLNLIYRWSPRLELGLAAYNFLDEDYAQPAPVGTLNDDFRGAGRSIRAELRFAFP